MNNDTTQSDPLRNVNMIMQTLIFLDLAHFLSNQTIPQQKPNSHHWQYSMQSKSTSIKCAKCQLFGIWHTKHQKKLPHHMFQILKTLAWVWNGTDINAKIFILLFFFQIFSISFHTHPFQSLLPLPLPPSSLSPSPSMVAPPLLTLFSLTLFTNLTLFNLFSLSNLVNFWPPWSKL